MYNIILIPIDITHLEKAEAMIDIARVQGGKNSQFIMLNVVEEMPIWVSASLPVNILTRSQLSAREALSNLIKTTGIHATIDIRIGHSYRTILQVAEESGADLIVIASHKPGMQDYFLGSTAAKVVRHAKCSVLVVR